jgi:hypothetical protein
MSYVGIAEIFLFLFAALVKFGIPLAVALWVVVAIKRIVSGIKRLSSRLDVIEQILHEKGDLEKL